MVVNYGLLMTLFCVSLSIGITLMIMGFAVGMCYVGTPGWVRGRKAKVLPWVTFIIGAILIIGIVSNVTFKKFREAEYDLPHMAEDLNLEPQELLVDDADSYITYMRLFDLEAYTYLVPEKPLMPEYLLETETST